MGCGLRLYLKANRRPNPRALDSRTIAGVSTRRGTTEFPSPCNTIAAKLRGFYREPGAKS